MLLSARTLLEQGYDDKVKKMIAKANIDLVKSLEDLKKQIEKMKVKIEKGNRRGEQLPQLEVAPPPEKKRQEEMDKGEREEAGIEREQSSQESEEATIGEAKDRGISGKDEDDFSARQEFKKRR